MVHFVLFFVILISFLGSASSKHIHRISFFVLFCFAALRYNYGNDYQSYLHKYEYIHDGRWAFDAEPLFNMICKVMPSFYVLIAVTSLVFIFMVFRFITKNLPNRYVFLGTFIFLINPMLFLTNLSSLRQCLAMLTYILAVDAACERKMWKYMALVVVAAMFHKSAWFLLPLYFFLNSKPFKALQIFGVLVGVVLAVTVLDLKGLAELVTTWFGDKNYIYYAQKDDQNTIRATLLTALYFIYTLFNLPKLKGKYFVYGKLYLLSTMFGLFAYQMSMFTRFQMFFEIFSVVVLPQIFRAELQSGPIPIRMDNPVVTVWGCINRYVMPVLLVLVYLLRYYSFFTNPLWRKFFEYDTILSLIAMPK